MEKALVELAGAVSAQSELLRQIAINQKAIMLGRERLLEFQFEGRLVRLYLPDVAYDGLQRAILDRGAFFELGLLRRVRELVPPGAVILDIGANIGNHSIFFAMLMDAAEVHAFEPVPATFATLCRNIHANALTGVYCHQLGVGAGSGRAHISNFANANLGATTVTASEHGRLRIASIDSLGLDRCGLIKIDVEGAQAAVLEGAAETLRRCRPIVWMEVRPGEEDSHSMLLDLGAVETWRARTDRFYRFV